MPLLRSRRIKAAFCVQILFLQSFPTECVLDEAAGKLEPRSRKPIVAVPSGRDGPAPPGNGGGVGGRSQGRYVRVLYNYEYTSGGRSVSIREGDECLLLKKTTKEWWSVIKTGEKRPIYVPANYVEEEDAASTTTTSVSEGRRRRGGGALNKHGSLEDVADDEKSRSSSEDLLQGDDSAFEPPPPENGRSSSGEEIDGIRGRHAASDDSLDRLGENRVRNMVDLYEAPEYANLEMIQAEARRGKKQAAPLPDEPEYSNVANIKAAFRSPPPRPEQGSAPARRFAAGWDMYIDEQTGRHFYYNRTSGESTWKPPRGLRAQDGTGSPVPPPLTAPKPPPAVPEKPPPSPGGRGRLKSFNSFGTAVVLANAADGEESNETDKDAQIHRRSMAGTSIPQGWSEEHTDEGVVYVNDTTCEKYLSSVDESGRVYFYKEDESESTWELPEAESGPSGTTPHRAHLQHHWSYLLQHPQHSSVPHQRHGSVDSALAASSPAAVKPMLMQHISPPPAVGHYPAFFRHSIAAGPRTLSEEDERDDRRDQRSPKLKPVGLPSVPDLVLSVGTEGAASGPGSPEVADSPVTPGFSPASSTDSPYSSLQRQMAVTGERKDMLNRTKVTEAGKKVKKNWTPSFVLIHGSTLYFYKDQKSAQPKRSSPWGRPDEVIDLHGALVEMDNKEKTSRKNSVLITLLSGTQWLLQSDDGQKIQQWYCTLSQNLAHMPQVFGTRGSQESLDQSSDSLERLDDEASPQMAARIKRKKSKKEKERDKGGSTHLTDKEKTNTLDDPNLTFPEKSSKIKDRLRNFFGQRPEKKTLQAKGIIKENVFGAHLQQLAEREKSNVPPFILQVISTIEKRGLDDDGIYRVSGNLSQIMKLRFLVDHNEKYELENPEWDIHVLTGALKLFFRELMEPLFPYKQFDMFLTGIKLPERSAKLKAFKDALKSLPKPNRETMKVLFKHLNNVIDRSRMNRMQTQNVAIVFGPTLMWPERETQNVAVTTVYQSQIVEFILLEYKSLFG